MSVQRLIQLLLLGLCCVSCSKPTSGAVEAQVTTFTIKSTKTTNDGAPFYVILKFTDFPHFLMDDYQTIANLSSMAQADNNSFMSICLIPGKTEKRIAIPPAELSTGIYCLFTNCGEEWKHLIDAKEGCNEVTIVLGDHEIKSVEIQ